MQHYSSAIHYVFGVSLWFSKRYSTILCFIEFSTIQIFHSQNAWLGRVPGQEFAEEEENLLLKINQVTDIFLRKLTKQYDSENESLPRGTKRKIWATIYVYYRKLVMS